MIRSLSAAARTLPLFRDVAPSLVLPRPRLVEPRGQLALFPLPTPILRPRVVLADPRQGQLFPGLLPVAPSVTRPRLRLVPGQLLLPAGEPLRTPDGKRRLAIVPPPLVDLFRATRGLCLYQADGCTEDDCRYHLGWPAKFQGETWVCAIDVANHFPRGLSPKAVATIYGTKERSVQSLEKKLLLRLRKEMDAGDRPDLDELHAEGYPSDDEDGRLPDIQSLTRRTEMGRMSGR